MSSTSPTGLFYTERAGAGVRTAQVLGLTATAFFAGKTFHQSFSTTPALLEAPKSLLTKQWAKMFGSDKWMAPAVALFGTGVFGYLAATEPRGSRTGYLYTAAAGLLVSMMPYTMLLLEPINQALERRAETGKTPEDELSDHELVDRWATINLGRAAATTASALLATWAAIDVVEAVPAGVKLATGANRLG